MFDPTVKLTEAGIKALPPLAVDGAWGTELAKLGAGAGEMCDPWNISAPEKVLAVAQSYVEAGAQIILTNTFNSNRIALERHGLADQAVSINRAGAELSRQAAVGKAYVFASMGPTGKLVMMGDVEPEEVIEAFAEQAQALAEGGADALLLETQTDLEEVQAAFAGARSACDLPIGISFTFDSGANNDRTMMGVTIPQACELALELGAAFVGANCGLGISQFLPLAKAYDECKTNLPLWFKGNAGLPELDSAGHTCFRATPEDYVAAAGPATSGRGAFYRRVLRFDPCAYPRTPDRAGPSAASGVAEVGKGALSLQDIKTITPLPDLDRGVSFFGNWTSIARFCERQLLVYQPLELRRGGHLGPQCDLPNS